MWREDPNYLSIGYLCVKRVVFQQNAPECTWAFALLICGVLRYWADSKCPPAFYTSTIHRACEQNKNICNELGLTLSLPLPFTFIYDRMSDKIKDNFRYRIGTNVLPLLLNTRKTDQCHYLIYYKMLRVVTDENSAFEFVSGISIPLYL